MLSSQQIVFVCNPDTHPHTIKGYSIPNFDNTAYNHTPYNQQPSINHYKVEKKQDNHCSALEGLHTVKATLENSLETLNKILTQHRCNNTSNHITLKRLTFSTPYLTHNQAKTDKEQKGKTATNKSVCLDSAKVRPYRRLTEEEKQKLDNFFAIN